MRTLSSCSLFFFAFSSAEPALWPQPTSVQLLGPTLSLDPASFAFTTGSSSALLTRGLARYKKLTFLPAAPQWWPPQPAPTAALARLVVTVGSDDEGLTLGTSEAYNFSLPSAGGDGALFADTVFGALRGLETFSQMVGFLGGASFLVNVAVVADAPRFPHRGALVDTARHFLALPALQAFVDGLAYTKMNVLHWHIVDAESFPYASAAFPGLAAKGAYAPAASHTYSQADVTALIAYAKDRGIRVVVEFDTPGHSNAWGPGQPGLLTECYNASGQADGTFGPINPTIDSTWTFLAAFFAEVAAVFPDPYIHVGGDEVSFDCWESNPDVVAWMAANGMAGNASALESYYVQRLLKLVQALGKTPIGWQEIFDNGLDLTPDTLVHVWKNPFSAGQEELARATAAGKRVLLSAGWYLNYISYGPVWEAAYVNDPLNFTGTAEQKVRAAAARAPPSPFSLTFSPTRAGPGAGG